MFLFSYICCAFADSAIAQSNKVVNIFFIVDKLKKYIKTVQFGCKGNKRNSTDFIL